MSRIVRPWHAECIIGVCVMLVGEGWRMNEQDVQVLKCAEEAELSKC